MSCAAMSDGNGKSQKASTAALQRSDKTEPHDGCRTTFGLPLHLSHVLEHHEFIPTYRNLYKSRRSLAASHSSFKILLTITPGLFLPRWLHTSSLGPGYH